jgi:two-component system, LuxR family, response regulator FixJ
MSSLSGEERVVAIVDDEPSICDSLQMLLRASGYVTRVFSTAESLLRDPLQSFICVLVDLRLPGMSGLELQAELRRRRLTPPVIVITAHGDVASARAALLAGAVDFLEKPIDNDELLAAVRAAAAGSDRLQQARVADARARTLLATLSAREREVFDRIVGGMHNREIAMDLGISPRTVEVYRAHVMAKLQARRLADLLRFRLALPQELSDRNGKPK